MPLSSVCHKAVFPETVAAAYNAGTPPLVAGAPSASPQASVTVGRAFSVIPKSVEWKMPELVDIHSSPAFVGLTAILTAVPLREALDAVQEMHESMVTYNVSVNAAYNTVPFTLSAAMLEPAGKALTVSKVDENCDIRTDVEGELGTQRIVLESAETATLPP